MISPDARLAAYFAPEFPSARDPVFQAEVLEVIARRAFYRDLVGLSVLSTAGAGLLWLMWPVLHSTLGLLSRGLAPGAICVGVAVSIIALTSHPGLGYRV